MSDSLRPRELQPARLLCPWNSSGKNIGVGCHSLFHGIFPTWGSNQSLLHCRQILYCLSHQEDPKKIGGKIQQNYRQDKSGIKGVLTTKWNINKQTQHRCFRRVIQQENIRGELYLQRDTLHKRVGSWICSMQTPFIMTQSQLDQVKAKKKKKTNNNKKQLT